MDSALLPEQSQVFMECDHIQDILEELTKSVITYEKDTGMRLTIEAIKRRGDPVRGAEALIKGVSEIGERYGRGELFLPELMMASQVMDSAVSIFQQEMKRRKSLLKMLGKIVIGTVFGKIHNMENNLVAALLTAEVFEGIDIGVNIVAHKFVEAVKEHELHILAMSALLTTIASEMRKTLASLEKEQLRHKQKIIVEKDAVTEESAKIGVEGYASTAPEAVILVKNLLGLK